MPRIYRRSGYALAVLCSLLVLGAAATACDPAGAQAWGEFAIGLYGTVFGGLLALVLLLAQIPVA